MRTIPGYLSLLAVVIGLGACVDDETNFLDSDLPSATQINFMDLAPGQSSRYIGYEQNCDSTNFRWTGDTLVTGIYEVDGQMYMSEQLTPLSPSNPGDNKGISYPIQIRDGVLTIPERELSKLFGFYGDDEIDLKPDERIDLQLSGCLLTSDDDVYRGNGIGYLRNFNYGEVLVEFKSVTSDPVPNVDAYLLYDASQIHVSHQVFSNSFQGVPLGGLVRGWVLID